MIWSSGQLRGSSPRVRGTLARRCGRFIPARAGNAKGRRSEQGQRSVHPRACGERLQFGLIGRDRVGSSPRVRGTLEGGARPLRRVRFIPARAGNASAPSRAGSPCPVHPRACGERAAIQARHRPGDGSSPRVRGTHHRRHVGNRRQRFIPARAGNATLTTGSWRAASVHPRACGERYADRDLFGAIHGSSPRVRGTLPLCLIAPRDFRFIPARAGNAPNSTSTSRSRPVHPRACGERVRRAGGGGGMSGFIPARAGNAIDPPVVNVKVPVHPRACGERAPPRLHEVPAHGSSPRVRGTRRDVVHDVLHGRFIPARAGNALARSG